MEVGEYINIQTAGLWQITGKLGFQIAAKYLDRTYNTHSGETVPVGTQIVPGSFLDGAIPSPRIWYKLTGHTANGITIPYNVVLIEGGSTAGGLRFAMSYGPSPGNDEGQAIACDRRSGNGSLVLAGIWAGSPYIAKFNSSGVFQWQKVFQKVGSGQSFGVAIDSSGNIIVTGKFSGTINMGDISVAGDGDITAVGYNDMFLAKYTEGGTRIWSARFGGAAGDTFGNSVAVDSSGRVVATGYFSSTVNFGSGTMTSTGGQDIFLAKFNSDGTLYGAFAPKQFGTGGGTSEGGNSVAVDSSGNVAFTGTFIGSVNFGGSTFSASQYNAFVVKYTSTGGHVWSRQFGATAAGTGIAFDSLGDIVVCGSFSLPGQGNFGGRSFTCAGYTDCWVAKYAGSNGTHRWSEAFGDWFIDTAKGITTDSTGNVYVAGYFLGSVNPGGGNLPIKGSTDCFLVKYGPGESSPGIPNFIWSQSWGSNQIDECNAITLGLNGDVITTGRYGKAMTLGNDNNTIILQPIPGKFAAFIISLNQ
jgi:uncharacterized protein (AIM24 family)